MTREKSAGLVRIDDIDVRIVRGEARFGAPALSLGSPTNVTAATPVFLPMFDGWIAGSELRVELEGRVAAVPGDRVELALVIDGATVGAPFEVKAASEGTTAFSVELVAPVGPMRGSIGKQLSLAVAVSLPSAPAAPPRILGLTLLTLVPIAEPGPLVQSMELLDVTDAELYGGAARRSFDLQNPEEGFWKSSGRALLRLSVGWSGPEGKAYALDKRVERLTHAFSRALPAASQAARSRDEKALPLVEEIRARQAASSAAHLPSGVTAQTGTWTEWVFDTGHADLGAIPVEGANIALDPEGTHAVTFKRVEDGKEIEAKAKLVWRSALSVRLRDPRPLLKTFQRLSAVGIDFGTSATVAALVQRGYRALLQLGRPTDVPARPKPTVGVTADALLKGELPSDQKRPGPSRSGGIDETVRAAENPVVLLVDDHEKLWAEMGKEGRFPHLVRVLRGSHAARSLRAEAPNSVVGELKALPDRVVGNDESPQLRDREKQRDFLLDESRVRALVRAYAYFLGRAINRPGQDIYLHYVLTHPSKSDAKSRALVDEEVRKGLLLSLPEDVPAEELRVEYVASEAEAFAVEVCPELCAHPDVAPIVERLGELRFVVFDLGGGTLDVACGRFRPATEAEQSAHGSSTVIETLQVNGQPDLGGEILTHELAWLVHQHDAVLPEMEEKEVPMMRPVTVPVNHLARRPELYKRGLAARQNWQRLDRSLGLERVKFGPDESMTRAPGLLLARIDGTETAVDAFGGDLSNVEETLRAHLVSRIKEGTKLLASTLASAPQFLKKEGEAGAKAPTLMEQGVLVLLAGNSSRSAFVGQAVAEELGLVAPGEPFEAWRPEGGGGTLQGIVLYETPPRMERGVSIVGVTPKTAVALGALKLANHEVHLVRATQGFGYFLGDLRGFPPKFTAIVPMGAPSGKANEPGPHLFDFGRWDTKMPLRVAREYVAGKMTSNDPRVFLVPTGLPTGEVGRLFVAVTAPDEVVLCLDRSADGKPAVDPIIVELNLAKALR